MSRKWHEPRTAPMTASEAVEWACRKAIVGGSFDSLNFAQQERAMTHMSAAILAALVARDLLQRRQA
jgi:hypothetical protein